MNSDSPLISIISPIYNCSPLIDDFIKFLKIQIFTNYELILVDGGSSDGTLKKLYEASKSMANIVLLSEPDKGIYDAMNKGMKIAKGKWLYFIGSDDRFFEENTLDKVSQHLTSDVDLVYGGYFDEKEKTTTLASQTKWEVFVGVLNHQSIFYRREYLQRIGEYNIRYKICADRDFNNRCFCTTDRIKYMEIIVCHYGGYGISSREGDVKYHREKYLNIQRETKKNLLSKFFRPCRFDFYKRSNDFTNFNVWRRMQYRALYIYHGVMNKVDF